MSPLVSSNLASEAPDFKYFFDIPIEIRQEILDNLVVSNEKITLTTKGLLRTPWCFRLRTRINSCTPPAWPLNYFLACKQMYREAHAVLLMRNTFLINCYAFHYQRHKGHENPGVTILPPKWLILKQMRRVILEINCRGNYDSLDHVRRASLQFKDMISFGKLRHLEVRITRSVDGEDSGLVSAPCLRAVWTESPRAIAAFGSDPRMHQDLELFWEVGPEVLRRLLRHPGLRIPRLAVAAVHHPLQWCEYHEETDGAQEDTDCEGMVSVECTAAPMVSCHPMSFREFLHTDLKALEKSVCVSIPAPLFPPWA